MDSGPVTDEKGPGPPGLNIGRWRDALGLHWSFEKHSIQVKGYSGRYTIMKLAALWILVYYHLSGSETKAIFTKGSKKLDPLVKEVEKIERQVLFDDMIQRTVRRDEGR